MPQMHPLLWTLLLSFSLTCLLFTMSITFFSVPKPTSMKTPMTSPLVKNSNWKW